MSSVRVNFFQYWNWRTLVFIIVVGLLVVLRTAEAASPPVSPRE